MSEFRDRVAIVTGAGSGIGRAVAFGFAREGAHVVVSDVDHEKVDETIRGILATGGSAIATHTDVSSPDECAAMVERALDHFGRDAKLDEKRGRNPVVLTSRIHHDVAEIPPVLSVRLERYRAPCERLRWHRSYQPPLTFSHLFTSGMYIPKDHAP